MKNKPLILLMFIVFLSGCTISKDQELLKEENFKLKKELEVLYIERDKLKEEVIRLTEEMDDLKYGESRLIAIIEKLMKRITLA